MITNLAGIFCSTDILRCNKRTGMLSNQVNETAADEINKLQKRPRTVLGPLRATLLTKLLS